MINNVCGKRLSLLLTRLYTPGIQQSCGSIASLVDVAREVDETTQRKATEALGERSESLSR